VKKLLYYPNFECVNKTWLKFALLYFDKLYFIVPESGEKYLSDEFKRVKGETDLINFVRIDKFIESNAASHDAIDEIKKILKNPQYYEPIIRTEGWKLKKSQRFSIFDEKYSHGFCYFCIENGIGHKFSEGIYVSRDVFYIYMTVLANIIAERRGLSTITDINYLHNFVTFSRRPEAYSTLNTSERIKVARAIVDLKVPKNLEDLEISKIIKLRNKENFRKKMKAFHALVEQYGENQNGESDYTDFFRQLKFARSDFLDLIKQLTANLVSQSLIFFGLFQFSGYLPGINDAAMITFDSAFEIIKGWKNTETKRFTKKYLASLSSLQRYSK